MWYVEYQDARIALYSNDFDTYGEAEAFAREKLAQGYLKATVKPAQ